jgi:hypothetical protein
MTFGVEFLRDDEHLKRQQSEVDLRALALAIAILDAKDIGANRIRLSDRDGVILDDFPLGPSG